MPRSRWWIVILLAAIALLAWQWLINHGPSPASTNVPTTAPATVATTAGSPHATASPAAAASAASATTSNQDGLPPEALATLRLIASHGPFPYDRDGVVFNNFEHRLPEQPRGYYREYTVPTPGASNRGARRIITGGEPPQVYYYSDDHYQSFRPIEGKR